VPPDPFRTQLQISLGTAYTLERELGGGGMSRVFVAHDTTLERNVVVKVLSPELAAGVSAERFTREIKLAAGLQQANIVPLLSAGETDGLPFYTMPFVDGLSLRARLERDGAVPIADAVSVLRDVARALVYAHERGVVHRDIKPENILLSGEAAVVTDFGIAKALSASRTVAPGGTLTQVGTSIGTPAYMAPEQASGDPATDHRADIYSLGCVAHELLTGAAPFAGRPVHQLFAAHLNETPAPVDKQRADTPRALAQLVARCMEKDPARRPQNAREMLQALDAVTTGSHPAAGSRARGRGIAAAAFVALIVTGIVVYRSRMSSASAATTLSPARVLVLPFENRTGDSTFAPLGAMAADWITRGLTETGLVDVASLPATTPTAAAAAVAAARDAAAGTVLSGTLYRVGDSVRVVATITDANENKVSTSLAPIAAPAANPMGALEVLRRRVAGALARRIDPAFDPDRLMEAPPSFETYRAMLDARREPELETRADMYRRIAAADTTYALPLLNELNARWTLREMTRADELIALLEQRRSTLTPYEQARVDLAKALRIGGYGGALNAQRRLVELAPRSAAARLALANALMTVNRMREAHEMYRSIDTARIGRSKTIYWYPMAYASHRLGAYGQELDEIDAALRAEPATGNWLGARARALAALGRLDEVAATLATADRSGPEAAVMAYSAAAGELLAHGHPAEAARAQAALVERARAFRATNASGGLLKFGSYRWLGEAAALALLNRSREALSVTDSASAELSGDPRQRLVPGLATDIPLWPVSLRGAVAAHAGDRAAALAADRMLDTLRPSPGFARASALVGRAAIAAQLGRRDDAVARLREAIMAGATFYFSASYSIMIINSGITPESPWLAPLRGYPPFEDLVRPVP
jgi:serine/threonine-protein kinase